MQGENIWKDFELNGPRKKYASSVTGGYYAARIEVAKYLYKRKDKHQLLSLEISLQPIILRAFG